MNTYSGYGSDGREGIAFDGTNMWIAGQQNTTIYKINITTNTTSTYTLPFNPSGIAFDGTNMWMVNGGWNDKFAKFPVNNPTNITTYNIGDGSYNYYNIIFDGAYLWTVRNDGNSIVKINPSNGATTTYSGTGSPSQTIAFDGYNLWTNNNASSSVTKIPIDNPTAMNTYSGISACSSWPWDPCGIAFDGSNNMWIVGNNNVTKININTNTTTTYSGTGSSPVGIAFDGTNMWTANWSNITKILIK